MVNTLIIDEDGVYDPRSPNDRLLLGMKGTMSEMELSVFRQRSVEARKQKARRGELFLTVAVGYVKTDDDRIEESRSPGAGCDHSSLCEVRGAADRPPSARLDEAGADPASYHRPCRATDRVAVAHLQDAPFHSD